MPWQRWPFSEPLPVTKIPGNAMSATGISLSDTSRKVLGIFRLPPGLPSTTLTRAAVLCTGVTGTSPTYRVALYNIDANGEPTGSALASYTVAPTEAGAILQNFSSPYNVGTDLFGIVVEYASGTVNGSNFASFSSNFTNQGVFNPEYMVVGRDLQGSWTTRQTNSPFAVGTSDGLYGGLVLNSASATSTGNFNSASSVNEYGLKFTVSPDRLPYTQLRLGGAVTFFTNLSGAGTMRMLIYQGGGASDTTPLQTVDRLYARMAVNRRNEMMFTSLSTLAAGTTYRISFAPQIANNAAIQTMLVTSDLRDQFPRWATDVCLTSRGGGSWTDDATAVIPLALHIVEGFIDDGGGGGGGGFYSPFRNPRFG